MTEKLKTLIHAAAEMSLDEREELIRAMDRARPAHETSTPASESGRLLAQLAHSQHVSPVKNVAELAVDFWPEDETADDVNNYVYRQRHEDRRD